MAGRRTAGMRPAGPSHRYEQRVTRAARRGRGGRIRATAREGWAMDFVKSQFDRIQQQLNGLTPSQKMLTGTLVTIMVMTLVWWGKYAGQPEMAPLLSQPLTDAEVSRIRNL